MTIRNYTENDLTAMIAIWNEVVEDCLVQAKKCGYGVLQFNAVVESNIHAHEL